MPRRPLTAGFVLAEAVVVEQAPFRHGVVRGLLASPAFAAALGDELLCLGFRERRNDLLSLRQVGRAGLGAGLSAVEPQNHHQ